MTDWQPIETATKGYSRETGFTQVLFLGYSSGRSFNHPVVVSGWVDRDGKPVQYYNYRLRITHWAPFPEMPR